MVGMSELVAAAGDVPVAESVHGNVERRTGDLQVVTSGAYFVPDVAAMQEFTHHLGIGGLVIHRGDQSSPVHAVEDFQVQSGDGVVDADRSIDDQRSQLRIVEQCRALRFQIGDGMTGGLPGPKGPLLTGQGSAKLNQQTC